ncbi:NAD-dependent epimerase/dehydratase family protein [bacterium]|nr:NAD-dependent epimerase/dehydratase family protein [bacterium]
MKNIMVIGAVGQIGSELTMALREKHGSNNVVAVGRRTKPSAELRDSGPFEFGNILDKDELKALLTKYKTDTIYLMAAILSATGEQNPLLAYRVNNDGLMNVLELSRELKLEKVLIPSSIAVFGPETPRDNTPNETILKPKTMYGISKVHGELLCDYYFNKYGLDVRGLRYPGIISYKTPPGGGTTDYTVEMYRAAAEGKPYTCFVKESTTLPMMYMPDALKSIMDLAEAPLANLKHHADFNVTAMSFSAGEMAASIRKYKPDFKITYEPDFRQAIADTWPMSLDDSVATEEWGWKPDFDLDAMTKDMLENLPKVLGL